MEIIIERNELFRWLSKIQNISEKRSTMPILANSLLRTETENDSIHIYATDLEVGIHGLIKGKIIQHGSTTIPSKKIFEIVRELPNVNITLRMTEQNILQLKCGKSFYTIMTLLPDQYPPFPNTENIDFIPIKAASFLDMINKTIFAIATESMPFDLKGVLLEKMENGKGERIRMVATDAHKLALVDKPVVKSGITLNINKNVIISRKGIHEIKRFLEELDSSVDLGFDEKSVFLKSHDTILLARLIEGEFPKYQEVIPNIFKRTVQVNRNRFTEALKRVSALAGDRSHVIRFSFEGDILKLIFSDPNIGEAEDEIEVTRYEGDPIEIGFNAAYFLDSCNVLSCDEILIKMNDQLDPGVVFPLEDEADYLCVVMPVKIISDVSDENSDTSL